ncbi:MAG: hypothetical protein ACI9L6_000843 [Flavobacterium sp.]|jgi:hypothetical protein
MYQNDKVIQRYIKALKLKILAESDTDKYATNFQLKQ